MTQAVLPAVEDTIFAMLATFLATGSRDVAGRVGDVQRDPKSKHYTFTFEGQTLFAAQRARGDRFVIPGVNCYFGDSVAIPRRVQPQIWVMPVAIHILVPYTPIALAGEKRAERIGEVVQDAFRGNGVLPLVDMTGSSPTLMPGKTASWSRLARGTWSHKGDPTSEDNTNYLWAWQCRYAR